MDPCHTLQTGTRPKRTRGEHCFLITSMILFIAGLFVLLNAGCTMCTWSVKPISTICDQRYLHVLWRWACHTAHQTIIIVVVLVRCATITMPALIVSCLKRNTAKKVMVAQAPPSYLGFEIESYDSYEIEPELGNP